jgi:hypothetical protein
VVLRTPSGLEYFLHLTISHSTQADFKFQVSCSLCRRKKLRCSRDQPCSNCVARQVICERDAPLPGRTTSAGPIAVPSDGTSAKSSGDGESALSERLHRVETLLLRLDAKIHERPHETASQSRSQQATPYSNSQYTPNAIEVAHRDDTRELDGVGATDADLVSRAFPMSSFASCTSLRVAKSSYFLDRLASRAPADHDIFPSMSSV